MIHFSGGQSIGKSQNCNTRLQSCRGFILAVAFHSPSKELTAASEPVLTPVVDLK
jgi:hypothetical protein